MSKVIMGFEFQNTDEYAIAKKELEYINKIKENMKTTNPEHLLEIYNKIISDGIFKTPVGMEYLRNIQINLVKNRKIDNSRIRNIPAIVYNDDNVIQSGQNSNDIAKNNIKKNQTDSKENKHINRYKDLYIKMIIVNVALVCMIIAMFIISHNAKKFDEDYYRESIENEYISWEKSIQERESVVQEKENNQ